MLLRTAPRAPSASAGASTSCRSCQLAASRSAPASTSSPCARERRRALRDAPCSFPPACRPLPSGAMLLRSAAEPQPYGRWLASWTLCVGAAETERHESIAGFPTVPGTVARTFRPRRRRRRLGFGTVLHRSTRRSGDRLLGTADFTRRQPTEHRLDVDLSTRRSSLSRAEGGADHHARLGSGPGGDRRRGHDGALPHDHRPLHAGRRALHARVARPTPALRRLRLYGAR